MHALNFVACPGKGEGFQVPLPKPVVVSGTAAPQYRHIVKLGLVIRHSRAPRHVWSAMYAVFKSFDDSVCSHMGAA